MVNQWTAFTSIHSFGRLARQMAVCAAVATLTACGGGGEGRGGGGQMVIKPGDAPDTLSEVLAADPTSPGSLIQESIRTPDDSDFYRFEFREPGMLTVSTEGSIETNIQAFDRDGIPLPTRSGSIIVDVTDDLIRNKGGQVIIRISSQNTGDYGLMTGFLPSAPPTPTSTPTSTLISTR